jgi:hypothetical protein
MTAILDWGIDYLGIIIGAVFIYLQMRAVHTLIGSAFKRHHFWMGVGSFFFSLAFLVDLIAVTDGNNVPLNITYHVLLIISAIIFIVTNFRLPHEASRYMDIESRKKHKAN